MHKTVSEVDFLIKKLKIVMYHIHLKAAFFLNTRGCKKKKVQSKIFILKFMG